MRLLAILASLGLLTACGGQRYSEPAQVMRLTGGPISRACMGSERKARNESLCGCIQTVANQDLSGSDQRKAVSFYGDPHRAQEVRQSDNPRDEAFWLRYKAYAQRSEKLCRGYS